MLQDEKAGMALEVRRQVDARTGEREAQVRAQEQERSGFEKAELQKKLDDVNSQLVDAQRKIAQGSQQLQGEVLELAIEDDLRREAEQSRGEVRSRARAGGAEGGQGRGHVGTDVRAGAPEGERGERGAAPCAENQRRRGLRGAAPEVTGGLLLQPEGLGQHSPGQRPGLCAFCLPG